MQHLILSAVSFFFLGLSAHAELKTVPYVDVTRYIGTWYQISRNPMPFENSCVCSQQTLGLLPSGKVSVYNTCNEGSPNGKLLEIRGTATNDDPASNSRFTVDFKLRQLGQYWIIAVDSDYRWAVVSEPNEKALFILSKTPQLAPDLMTMALSEAGKQVDLSQLRATDQTSCVYP